jgi:hypothetical protein
MIDYDLIDNLEQQFADAIWKAGHETDRGAQSKAGIMGPSDLGFCRAKAVFMTRQADSEERPTWAAQVGTAIHTYLSDMLKDLMPGWDFDVPRMTATFPSGAQVAGTPDAIGPNMVIDFKTSDGLSYAKLHGPSQNHRYQRHTYALAAIQAGLFDETKPIYVGNLYLDRSGREPRPYLTMEEFDPTLTVEIDSWIQDVIYSVQHDEQPAQDVPAPVCQAIGCEFYSVCRGDLPIHEGGEFITDPTTVNAVNMYVKGRDMERTGKIMKKDAEKMLVGVNGTTGEWTVRWTSIAGGDVPGYSRAASERIDIRRPGKKPR